MAASNVPVHSPGPTCNQHPPAHQQRQQTWSIPEPNPTVPQTLNYRLLESKFPDVLKVDCNYHSYQYIQNTDTLNVKGRLRENKLFWHNIGASSMVLSIHPNSTSHQYVKKKHFKLDDWKTGLLYLYKDALMFNFDLKAGYHHIEVAQESQKYLGLFEFSVLPFGLTTAPYIFTKVLKPLVTHWRSSGIFIALYLDVCKFYRNVYRILQRFFVWAHLYTHRTNYSIIPAT